MLLWLVGATHAQSQIGIFDRIGSADSRVFDCREIEKVVEVESAWANTVSRRLEGKSQSFAYLRPNLLYTRKFVIVHFYFFCFLGGVTGRLAPRPPP